MSDPWGEGQPAAAHASAPLPHRLARMAALTGSEPIDDMADWAQAQAEELPEVAALMRDGWRPVDSSHELLPAVWPHDLRCWLPDRLPVISTYFDGLVTFARPASAAPHDPRPDWEADQARLAGLPPPPAGRIWLLRSPWPEIGMAVVVSLLIRRCTQLGRTGFEPDYVDVAREMLTWSFADVRHWWTGTDADTARAWLERGRSGEDVADLVTWELGPTQLDQLDGIDESAAVRWCRSVGRSGNAAVQRILIWRSLGLPADPPADLYRFHDWPAEQIASWLQAGFDIPTMIALIETPLTNAIEWRARGYRTSEVVELINADPLLTAEEADAFTELGIVGREQLGWIEYGFSADDAARFANLGIQPNEARVWRSRGLGPGDVVPGQALPPGYQRGGWAAAAGTSERDIEHSVKDPPGTRGRMAEKARSHEAMFGQFRQRRDSRRRSAD